jgi:hypothetical protein
MERRLRQPNARGETETEKCRLRFHALTMLPCKFFAIAGFQSAVKSGRWTLFPAKKSPHFTCALLALLRKPLIINGAGEGNRTLVSKVVQSGVKLLAPLKRG